MDIQVHLESLKFGAIAVGQGEALSVHQQVFGNPSRSESIGEPAPHGHRNNVMHFYDDLGITLNEHHATRLISSVNFKFEPERTHFPTLSDYTDKLLVCGVETNKGKRFEEFASRCAISFKPHLGHAWYYDGNRISIQFEVVSPSGKRGAKKTLISELSVGFRDAHQLKS